MATSFIVRIFSWIQMSISKMQLLNLHKKVDLWHNRSFANFIHSSDASKLQSPITPCEASEKSQNVSLASRDVSTEFAIQMGQLTISATHKSNNSIQFAAEGKSLGLWHQFSVSCLWWGDTILETLCEIVECRQLVQFVGEWRWLRLWQALPVFVFVRSTWGLSC